MRAAWVVVRGLRVPRAADAAACRAVCGDRGTVGVDQNDADSRRSLTTAEAGPADPTERVPLGSPPPGVTEERLLVPGAGPGTGEGLPVWGTPEPAVAAGRLTARRGRNVIALLVAAAVGAAVAYLAVWAADLVSPTRAYTAVVDEVREFTSSDEGGTTRETRNTAALLDDGRTMDVRGTSFPGGPVYGEPVVLSVSAWTGRIVGVRTAEGGARDPLEPATIVLVGLVGVVPLVATLTRARAVWRLAPRSATVAAAGLALLVVGAVELRGPYRGPSQYRLTDEFGMGIYGRNLLGRWRPTALPPTVAPGATAQVGDLRLQITGAARTTQPAGASGWLHDFHVVVVPIRAVAPAPSNPSVLAGYLPLELIGRGTGSAVLLSQPACAGVPSAFNGEFPPGVLRIEGPACFVVPKDFIPQYLVAGIGETASALVVQQ